MENQGKQILIIFSILIVMFVIGFAFLQAGDDGGQTARQGTVQQGPSPRPQGGVEQARPIREIPPAIPLLREGTPAPNFTLTSSEGTGYSLSQFQGEKPVLVEFLSTKCPHCQASVPEIKQFQQAAGDSVQILAVNAGDRPGEPSTSAAFIEEYGITYPILENPRRELLMSYNLSAFPTFYLVDESGNIAWSHVGTFTPETREELAAEI